jgi:DNA invertase Pin-like site-specific DNA recombinase
MAALRVALYNPIMPSEQDWQRGRDKLARFRELQKVADDARIEAYEEIRALYAEIEDEYGPQAEVARRLGLGKSHVRWITSTDLDALRQRLEQSREKGD